MRRARAMRPRPRVRGVPGCVRLEAARPWLPTLPALCSGLSVWAGPRIGMVGPLQERQPFAEPLLQRAAAGPPFAAGQGRSSLHCRTSLGPPFAAACGPEKASASAKGRRPGRFLDDAAAACGARRSGRVLSRAGPAGPSRPGNAAATLPRGRSWALTRTRAAVAAYARGRVLSRARDMRAGAYTREYRRGAGYRTRDRRLARARAGAGTRTEVRGVP